MPPSPTYSRSSRAVWIKSCFAVGISLGASHRCAKWNHSRGTASSSSSVTQFIVNPTLDQKLLAKFPPTIFFTGTRDFAMSGALFGYRNLIKLGVDSQILVFDGLYHGFMTNPDFPEAQEGYKIAAAFYDKHLGK